MNDTQLMDLFDNKRDHKVTITDASKVGISYYH